MTEPEENIPYLLDQMDRAGKKYWNGVWEETRTGEAFDPDIKGLVRYIRHYFYLQLHILLHEIFSDISTRNMKILEIGCANSTLLPYLAREYGFEVSGIDYSDVGCRRTEEILEKEGIKGKIICDDFLNLKIDLSEQFDAVISIGVVEHISDTQLAITKIASYAKAGGKIITLIPNMVGMIGILQKYFNREIFNNHVPLTPKEIKCAHENAGLTVTNCSYWLFTNFGVVNLRGMNDTNISSLIKKGVNQVLWRFSNMVWLFEKLGLRIPANRLTSPYIMCIAEK